MERGSSKHGPGMDDHLERDAEALERSGKDGRVEEAFESEAAAPEELDEPGSGEAHRGVGERIAGSGSSAERFPLRDHGEQGGTGHPRPRSADEVGHGD